jgi:hypothetical protein
VQFTLETLMDLNDEPLPSSIKQSTQPRGKERKNKERGPKSKPQSKTQTESQRGKGTNYKVQSQGWALGDSGNCKAQPSGAQFPVRLSPSPRGRL